MIIGVGTDIVEVSRIAAVLSRYGQRFAARILGVEEMRPALTQGRQAAYLSRQFAAKEAVAKVLGTGMRAGVHFKDIRVLRNSAGAPVVVLHGGAEAAAGRLGITRVLISLADERDYAIAYAVGVAD